MQLDKNYIPIISIKLKGFLAIIFVYAIACLNISPAYADSPGNLYPPFDIGSSWNICQGFENASGTHNGSSHLALDLTNSGCDNAATGRVVRAPFTGSVSWYVASSGSLCVTALDGRSVMMTHIDSNLTPGTLVDNYQAVGNIAGPGQRQNNGVAHIHLQAWSSPMCSNNNNQIPFDAAHNTRICGAPDFAANGPNTFNNGIWGSTRFIADACSTSIPPASPSVYRFYSPITQHHLYTADVNEVNILRTDPGWNYENTAYIVKSTSGCAANESVYRFYSERLKVHLYTMDENERSVLSTYPPDAWKYEGVSFCTARSSEPSTRPVYRFYSEGLKSHLFTADENEKNELMKHLDVWRYEGVAYYVY
ncbi:MAG: hypothetical protein ABIQ04_04295 [Candidatus Saccharimonadales bacterium]